MSRNLISKGFSLETEVRLLKEELNELQYKEHSIFKPFQNSDTTDEEKVDALCDLIVVATGAIYKLGYDADKAMDETLKEISSRIGSINPDTGKWEKDLSVFAQKKWKKANYEGCKL
jgi:predicted HAD superfamily Cof-like phosphohydrolase